jgi:long-chain fatty acid transport protein
VDSIPGVVNAAYAGFENHYEVSGSDWGYGFNLGAYYKLNDVTTLGLTYRSEIDITLEGDSTFDKEFKYFTGTAVGTFGDIRPQASKVPLTTPQSVTLAMTHKVTEKLLLQAGATWTGWSSFKSFDVIATENTAAMGVVGGNLVPLDGVVDISDVSQINGLGDGYIGHIDESWKDVWALALGTTYQLNDSIALRAGYAYDQSPVKDDSRTARVPASDRQWLTIGAQYVVSNDLSVDVAAGYLFMYPMDLVETNKNLKNETIGAASVAGEYEIDVFALSAQVNYKF